MEAGYFIIAILGCGDASANCTPVATAPARYESAAACSAATPDALAANTDLDFPTLVAQCRSVARPVSASSEQHSNPAPAGTLRS